MDYNLVITEIMYNPPESGEDVLEFIELYNFGSSVNLGGLYFSDGIEFEFPPVVLGAGEFFLVAKNADAFQDAFGIEAEQWTDGALSNGGELLQIMDLSGNIIDQVDYSDAAPWPLEPDGNGPSLTFCYPTEDNNVGELWYASVSLAGQNSQGQDLFATPGEFCEFIGVNEPPRTMLSIYPNPGEGLFSVDFGNTDSRFVKVYNLTGELIFEDQTTGNEMLIDLRDKMPGIYLLHITNKLTGEIVTNKLIIN